MTEFDCINMENKMLKIKEYVEMGKPMIYPERLEEWMRAVTTTIASNHELGYEILERSLKAMAHLEKGDSCQNAHSALYGITLGAPAAYMAKHIIGDFSKRGPEFYEAVKYRDGLDPEKQEEFDKHLSDLKAQNDMLAAKYNSSEISIKETVIPGKVL